MWYLVLYLQKKSFGTNTNGFGADYSGLSAQNTAWAREDIAIENAIS